MRIPLSKLGITSEEYHLLSDRLNPAANEIFLKDLANKNGYIYEALEHIDYKNNEIFQFEQFCEKRERNAKRNVPIRSDRGTTQYPYTTIEEAQAKDKKSHHILLTDDHKRGIIRKTDDGDREKDVRDSKGYEADDEKEEPKEEKKTEEL